jgi:thymidylate synthase ThyX
LTEDKEKRIGKLLAFLAENKHHTPFEKSYLHFLVTCETASHIHFIKHRIGVSVNAESARYKELKEDKYYIPEDWPEDLQAYLKINIKDNFEIIILLVQHWRIEDMTEKEQKNQQDLSSLMPISLLSISALILGVLCIFWDYVIKTMRSLKFSR